MRRAQAVLISTGASVAGLLVAACGASHSATTTRMTTPATTSAATTHVAEAAAHARIGFVDPRAGAHLGSTVHVRVRLSKAGRVRYILDGGRARVSGATTIVYRHLTPGTHRLEAELLVASGGRPAATAMIRFRVRRPPAAPVTAPPPPVTTTAPAPPVPSQTATAAPPAPPPTAAPPTPPPTAAPPAPPTGIPQNGGGDDDNDNHGAPSDGDGNI
jgi:hypothetical protein